MYRTFPPLTSSSRAAIVSSTGVSGSGMWSWYRSMQSVRSRVRDFSAASLM
jgi:hypothetical protein